MADLKLAGRDRIVFAAAAVAIAGAEIADLVSPRDVAFGGLTVAVVATAALMLPRGAVATLMVCAILGRALAGAVGDISSAGATMDGCAAAATALSVLWFSRRQLSVGTPAATGQRTAATESVDLVGWSDVAFGPRTTMPGEDVCLSPREREVIGLALRGLTAPQIGKHLFIGERTVETYLARVYAKYGVSSKAELAERMLTAHERMRNMRAMTDTARPVPVAGHAEDELRVRTVYGRGRSVAIPLPGSGDFPYRVQTGSTR